MLAQQFSGVATLTYYAVSIMESSGSSLDKYSATIIYGVTRHVLLSSGNINHELSTTRQAGGLHAGRSADAEVRPAAAAGHLVPVRGAGHGAAGLVHPPQHHAGTVLYCTVLYCTVLLWLCPLLS